MAFNYKIIKKIGSGSFGDIFLAKDFENHRNVALKREKRNLLHSFLRSEYKFLRTLNPGIGIPMVYKLIEKPCSIFLVMELLGPSLADLFEYCSNRFSLKTVILLAIQMINRLEYVHKNNIIHCDIKPDNFLMGILSNDAQVYLIDFGLARKYVTPDNEHIPFGTGRDMTGTVRYTSVNSLRGYELSRRDDMESLGYVFMYFLRGSLPWQGLTGPKTQRKEMVAEKKASSKAEDLCNGFPMEFATYLNYCRCLPFNATPDYNFLRRILFNPFVRFNYVNDKIFDWLTINALKENAESKKNSKDNNER